MFEFQPKNPIEIGKKKVPGHKDAMGSIDKGQADLRHEERIFRGEGVAGSSSEANHGIEDLEASFIADRKLQEERNRRAMFGE